MFHLVCTAWMAATPASRNHHAKQRQPPLPRTRQSTSVGVSPHPSAPPPRTSACSSSPPSASSTAGALRWSHRIRAHHRGTPPRLRPAAMTPRWSAPHLHPPHDARRGPQGTAAPRRTNAAGARHGPATAPVRLRPPPSWRFILAHSRSSDGSAYGRVRRPLAQGGTKRPPRSPSEMGAAGMLSFFFPLFLLSQFFHMMY